MFIVYRRYNYITEIFIFTYFYMRSKFLFCSKGMKTIQTIKITVGFYVTLLNNADNFLLQDNATVFLHLESLKE